MKRFVLTVLAVALIAMTAACNTMQGLGTDISQGGQAIHKAATR